MKISFHPFILHLIQLIVLTDAPLSTQLIVNDWTRKHDRRFIAADSRGLFGFIFVDVGSKFKVNDSNGERCKEVCLSLHLGCFADFCFVFNSLRFSTSNFLF